MKFVADNIRELSRKNKERNIKRSIKMVKNKVKMEARYGYDMCIFDFDTTELTFGLYYNF